MKQDSDYLAILRELRDYNRGIAEYIKGPSFEADRADALDTAIAQIERLTEAEAVVDCAVNYSGEVQGLAETYREKYPREGMN